MKRLGRRTVFTAAATLAGVSLLVGIAVAVVTLVTSLLHLAWLFLYVFATGAAA